MFSVFLNHFVCTTRICLTAHKTSHVSCWYDYCDVSWPTEKGTCTEPCYKGKGFWASFASGTTLWTIKSQIKMTVCGECAGKRATRERDSGTPSSQSRMRRTRRHSSCCLASSSEVLPVSLIPSFTRESLHGFLILAFTAQNKFVW